MTSDSIRQEIAQLQNQLSGIQSDMRTPGISGAEKASLGRAAESLSRQISARQDALAQLKEGYAEKDVHEEMGRQISAGARKVEVEKLKAKGYVEKKGLLYSPGGAVITKAGARAGFLSPYQEASPFYKGKYPVAKPAIAPTITPRQPAVQDITLKPSAELTTFGFGIKPPTFAESKAVFIAPYIFAKRKVFPTAVDFGKTFMQFTRGEGLYVSPAGRKYVESKWYGKIPGIKSVALMRKGRLDRKSTRLNSSHIPLSRMPSSA